MGRLKIIGAGTPSPNPDRWGTCFLLESRDGWLMVDCGPGSTYKMFRAGVSPTQIQHLFFTHLHSDHVSDYACFLRLGSTIRSAWKGTSTSMVLRRSAT